MRVKIVQIGNSQGVRIPKILLEQLKFKKTVEFEILPEGLLLRPVTENDDKTVRASWAEQFAQANAEAGGDDSANFADWNDTELSEFDRTEW
jgi:antitoxin MazE